MFQKQTNYSEKLLLKIEKGNYQTNTKHVREKNKHSATINSLIKNGFIIKNDKRKIKITTKGLIKLQRIKWKNLNLKNIKNEKKCIVVFDIPENIKKMRDLYRRCLYELGFEKIQKSVFLGSQKTLPYVNELTKNCKLQNHVIIIIGSQTS